MSPPEKIVVPPSKEKRFVLGGMPKRFPDDKYRKKLNVFYTWSLWVQTAAILSSILLVFHRHTKCNTTRNAILQYFLAAIMASFAN